MHLIQISSIESMWYLNMAGLKNLKTEEFQQIGWFF